MSIFHCPTLGVALSPFPSWDPSEAQPWGPRAVWALAPPSRATQPAATLAVPEPGLAFGCRAEGARQLVPPQRQAPGGRPGPAEPHGGHAPSLWTAAPCSPPFLRLGVLFAPLLPAMQIAKLLLLFYVKKVRCPLGPRRAAGPWAPAGHGRPGWAAPLADTEPRDLARVAWGRQPRASLWGQSPDPRNQLAPPLHDRLQRAGDHPAGSVVIPGCPCAGLRAGDLGDTLAVGSAPGPLPSVGVLGGEGQARLPGPPYPRFSNGDSAPEEMARDGIYEALGTAPGLAETSVSGGGCEHQPLRTRVTLDKPPPLPACLGLPSVNQASAQLSLSNLRAQVLRGPACLPLPVRPCPVGRGAPSCPGVSTRAPPRLPAPASRGPHQDWAAGCGSQRQSRAFVPR